MPIADRAVPELIRLSRDRSARVRNWATFGLSQQLGDPHPIDTPEIREALAARLQDDAACAEAAFGLAARGDRRALPIVQRALEGGPEACGNEWDWGLWLASATRLG
jgi:HEAT repeat protein